MYYSRCVFSSIITQMSSMRDSPLVHPAVDDGIVHGVAHGEPVNGQVDVLYVRMIVYLRIFISNQEEDVLGQPANSKNNNNHNHHLHNLEAENNRLLCFKCK